MSKRKRSILTLLDIPQKKRSKKENKRVKEYLAKKEKLDEMTYQPCKVCGKSIPSPSIYCSSECRRKENGDKRESKKTNS